MLAEADGKVAMKKTQVYECHKRFRDGRASVIDDPLCGRQSASTNDKNIVCAMLCQVTDDISGSMNMSWKLS
jgi:hypothetical protein